LSSLVSFSDASESDCFCGREFRLQSTRPIKKRTMIPKPAETAWISTDTRVPKSGQTVEARARYTDQVQVVTFKDLPARRWEHKNVAYQFEYFAYWRPLP
jgi:hypothetical protein